MLEMDERMRAELDEDGFTVLESFIVGDELERIRAAVLDVAKHGDGGAVSEIALEMMSYEPLLPYLVSAMGWNIHMRDGLMTSIAPQQPNQQPSDAASRLGTNWHIDQEEEFKGVTHDGTVPLMELKISYYLSDATEDGHASTLLIPGSHRWTPEQRATWQDWITPNDVVPLRVPCGSVLLWCGKRRFLVPKFFQIKTTIICQDRLRTQTQGNAGHTGALLQA
jgi:ectoine hydroxylase-related dioxygenase (phytanoyl-CoA dioxygenase family)